MTHRLKKKTIIFDIFHVRYRLIHSIIIYARLIDNYVWQGRKQCYLFKTYTSDFGIVSRRI